MSTPDLPSRWRRRIGTGHPDEALLLPILETPAIRPARDGVVLFATVGTASLLSALVALKSFWRQVRRGRIAVLDDGSLTPSDKALLARHCGDPEILDSTMVPQGGFPESIGWRGLLALLDRRQGEYWVRLGRRTVTLGPVPEVAQAIAMNRSFAMPGGRDAPAQGILPLTDFARQARAEGREHSSPQRHLETLLGRMRQDMGWRYLRGSPGVAGFAAGGPGRPLAAAFFAEAIRVAGPAEAMAPGSEQVAAGFLLANEISPVLLPAERYCEDPADDRPGETVGFAAFAAKSPAGDPAHAELARQAIAALKSGETSAAA